MIPIDGPRLCPQHTRECADSWTIYKDASGRAEALQPRVLNLSRRLKTGRFHVLREIEEAVDVTEEFLFWAKKELDERRKHSTRFYAYVGSDPGHQKRISNVEKLVAIASAVRFDLTIRKYDLQVDALRRDSERAVGEWTPQQLRSSSPGVQQVRVLRCCAVSIFPPDEESEDESVESEVEAEELEDSEDEEFEEHEPEEPEELDDSALGATMDEEELLADERAAQEVSEMLRWYSQSGCVTVSVQVVGHTHAGGELVETLTRSMVEYFPPIRILVHSG
ncbi:hypothetical protein K466DRAFT_602619 [Polyporus arcularius HHB13444]|uniref:Uncharacterized protein n=1 Tax=Polyporus arcularius HHB13444 TaxID=1314778 RepID=A0A5C3P590_9APHY|nr:hypothetical protein K466DRAFT_602619 [Polyporus arcularius HHB13444]